MKPKAVILLSGGLDSATCLAIARAQNFDCYTLSFDYGQGHRAELNAAKIVSEKGGAIQHKVVYLNIGEFGGSAITDKTIDVPDHIDSPEIPVTYVPARNTVFLSIALGLAEVLGAKAIFIGASSVDYSAYPDCRPEYFPAFQQLADLATKTGVEGETIQINAPLLFLSKAETIKEGLRLGVDYANTISCYRADDQGRACGSCSSCTFRKRGFTQLGVEDPTRYV